MLMATAGITIGIKSDTTKLVKKLRNGMGTFTRENPKIAREAINKHLPEMMNELEDYPPERPEQTYVRTFTLREGWETDTSVSQSSYSIDTFNDTPYTGYVQGFPDLRMKAGGKGQAWMHVGRWPIAGGIIKRAYVLIQETYERNAVKRFEELVEFKVTKRSRRL